MVVILDGGVVGEALSDDGVDFVDEAEAHLVA